MSIQKINNAVLLEIGEIKKSTYWTNVYLKFKDEQEQEKWYYYSEHVDKPNRLKQIPDFENNTCSPGMSMTVNYKIVQARNKSTKLAIINLSNYQSIK